MRKVTQETVLAFFEGRNTTVGNTTVHVDGSIVSLSLHGSIIAKKNLKTCVVSINNCGYESNTTKERLNGILSHLNNDYIQQKDFTWYIVSDGKRVEFPSNTWVKLK